MTDAAHVEEAHDDVAVEFLTQLGHAIDPIDWDVAGLPVGARRVVTRVRLLADYPGSRGPFRIFHAEAPLNVAPAKAIDPVVDAVCRRCPQGDDLFLFGHPGGRRLILARPRREKSRSGPIHAHRITLDLDRRGRFERILRASLRLRSGEARDGDWLAEKYRHSIDALRRLRQRLRRPGPLDPDRLFAADLQRYRVLPHEEQLALLRLAHEEGATGREARNRLLLHNLRLVRHHVWRCWKPEGLDRLDLVQEGVFGLCRAIERFNPDRGTHFSTYALHWIRQAVNRAIDNHAGLVRVPVHQAPFVRRARRAATDLDELLGGPATNRELALYLEQDLNPGECQAAWFALASGMRLPAELERKVRDVVRDIRWVRAFLREPLSLSGPVRISRRGGEIEESESLTLEEWLLAPEPPAYEEVAWAIWLDDAVQALLARLDEPSRELIEQHYGLGGRAPLTLDQLARRYGTNRAWLEHIACHALQRMRVWGVREPWANGWRQYGE